MVLSTLEHRSRRALLTAIAVLGCFVILLAVAERDLSSVVFCCCLLWADCVRRFRIEFASCVCVDDIRITGHGSVSCHFAPQI